MAKKRNRSDFNKVSLKNLRIAAGLSQPALAKKVGVDRQTAWRWENPDSTEMPSEVNLRKIAKAVSCKVDDLFGEFDPEFREQATETIRELFNLAYQRYQTKGNSRDARIATAIYFGLFPTPLQHDVNLEVSEAEKQVDDLLSEGDAPDYKKE